MAADLDLFRVLAGEFAATADGTVETMLETVTVRVSSAAFGARTTEAIVRLAAHELTLIARATAGSLGFAAVGTPTSLRAGDLSVGMAGPSSASRNAEDDSLRQTHHGLAYLAIRDSRASVGIGLLL